MYRRSRSRRALVMEVSLVKVVADGFWWLCPGSGWTDVGGSGILVAPAAVRAPSLMASESTRFEGDLSSSGSMSQAQSQKLGRCRRGDRGISGDDEARRDQNGTLPGIEVGVEDAVAVNGCGRPSESARWRRPADAAHSRPSRHPGCWRRGTRQPCRCRPRPHYRMLHRTERYSA